MQLPIKFFVWLWFKRYGLNASEFKEAVTAETLVLIYNGRLQFKRCFGLNVSELRNRHR